jgi:hypothetical protein
MLLQFFNYIQSYTRCFAIPAAHLQTRGHPLGRPRKTGGFPPFSVVPLGLATPQELHDAVWHDPRDA